MSFSIFALVERKNGKQTIENAMLPQALL